jgi:hypothetical protein
VTAADFKVDPNFYVTVKNVGVPRP